MPDSTVVLYSFPGSCAFASLVTLELVGASYQLNVVDLTGDKRAYESINPKGRVPALVVDNQVLTETPAILVYLAQKHPEAELLPYDPLDFAQLQSFNSYLCATVHVAHAHKYRGYRWADQQASFDDMRQKVPQTMTECFQLIESEYLQGPWVMGEQFTVADVYLVTVARWLESDGVDVNLLPRVMEHRTRMLEIDAVKAALASESADKAS